ncbi:uncharacterized protein V1516DRAFT_285916 [Lipomyces oligophaga]|uniref:uncharacterized protein n=1 Tax=Lipomyces oligophaga TaxID=45792 RepID=UPI0034CFE1A8
MAATISSTADRYRANLALFDAHLAKLHQEPTARRVLPQGIYVDPHAAVESDTVAKIQQSSRTKTLRRKRRHRVVHSNRFSDRSSDDDENANVNGGVNRTSLDAGFASRGLRSVVTGKVASDSSDDEDRGRTLTRLGDPESESSVTCSHQLSSSMALLSDDEDDGDDNLDGDEQHSTPASVLEEVSRFKMLLEQAREQKLFEHYDDFAVETALPCDDDEEEEEDDEEEEYDSGDDEEDDNLDRTQLESRTRQQWWPHDLSRPKINRSSSSTSECSSNQLSTVSSATSICSSSVGKTALPQHHIHQHTQHHPHTQYWRHHAEENDCLENECRIVHVTHMSMDVVPPEDVYTRHR